MQIIKKDGRVEEFDASKIITSINNAASESDIQLNSSDINIIVEDIEQKLLDLRGDKSTTSSYEVVGLITMVLKEDKFLDVLNTYIGYKK